MIKEMYAMTMEIIEKAKSRFSRLSKDALLLYVLNTLFQ